MQDEKELVIIKILSELQERYDINNQDVKSILDKFLSPYTLLSNDTSLMVSDLPEKITFFLGLKSLEGLSNQSLQRYLDELNMFGRYCLKPVSQIDINDLRRYFTILKSQRDYAKSTINGKISVLKSFFGTLYKEEVIPKDPTVRLKNIKVDVKNLREHLTVEELEKARNACKDIREKAMVEFLYSTAVRVSEAVGTNKQDVNWNDNSLEVYGKGDKNRTVFYSIKCKLYLQEYINTRTDNSEALFVSERRPYNRLGKSGIEKAISKIGERTDINKNLYPHILRHSFATHALQGGMDITLIQQLLGHEQINTTQIYAKNSSKQLQAAYEKLMIA